MRKTHLTVLLSLLMTLVACSGNVKQSDQPGWVSGNDKRFPSTLYLTGRGSASRLDEASDRARADLAKIFEVDISEASTDTQAFEEKSGGDMPTRSSSLKVTRAIEVRTGRILHGVEIAESWHDPESGTFYALAVLKRQPAAQALRDDIKRHDQATRLYISRAQRDDDLLKRIAAANRAVNEQEERAYLLQTLDIIMPGSGSAPPWSVDRLRADRETLLQRLVLVDQTTGEHAADVGPLLKAAVAGAGFSNHTDGSGDKSYRLAATVALDGPIFRDDWYWLRGTLELKLLNPDGTERGIKRWPVKASAQNSDACYRRVLDQVDSIFKRELRDTVISFASDS